uniref:Uncharacterized protein n=1 Tax=Ciona savignyi TaxID=51511 RepID=H2YD40_CIOSA
MSTSVLPVPPSADSCWSYRIALAVVSTVLALLVLAAGVYVTWRKLKTAWNRRRSTKNEGLVTIGRRRERLAQGQVQTGIVFDNNNRPNISALHDKGACPVVIPTIHVTVNEDETESMTSQDMTYAHIRRGKARSSHRLASPLSRATKPSGEYADLVVSPGKPQPSRALDASTPISNQNPRQYPSNTDDTYISPVQYKRPSTNITDTQEVFDNDIPGIRSRLASAISAIPRRISSTISALGTNAPPAVTPSNSPRLTSSANDAIYLSFHDGSDLASGCRVVDK